ncbi:hypothetical protein OPV22_017712 [Ensete ventricosum]|uniref:Transcription factor CBF/NF-Y/archaeal histone domain-containing protein n=1 Tax=Ensete ventricosum TaxID=4639 RepID=A0AAV8QYL2_ENSVE|nr:hypothetical protein OPV22_017712 [Ensete ventricosum]
MIALFCWQTRIKKIMQSDEDIGKIALAVPVLVSKALELFLQDLCDKTYSITDNGFFPFSGASVDQYNTLVILVVQPNDNILALKYSPFTFCAFWKQCVHKFTVVDFLKDLVGKVPDVGGSDADPNDKADNK